MQNSIIIKMSKLLSKLKQNDRENVTVAFLYPVINQLDAQNFCFTISLFHASTCFEHMYSSSSGQNCITQPLI